MRTNRFWIPASLALLAMVASNGCLVVPKLKDKVIDLVTGGEVASTFVAAGVINTFNATQSIDLRSEIDIPGTLEDAGIDMEDVKSITVSGVSYRVTKAQAGRTITDGVITVQREGGSLATLVPSFTADAGAITGWITPTLDPAGVTQLNNLLADIVTELHGGAPANEAFSYGVSGTSNPIDTNSDFEYQIRLTISIVGTVKTKWLE